MKHIRSLYSRSSFYPALYALLGVVLAGWGYALVH